MQSRELLDTLIRFPTVSRDSNLDLIAFIRDYLAERGHASELVHNEEKTKANLYALIGPADKPGVMLSGHTDVVPVDGQDWSTDPFVMHESNGCLLGRGSCDMKGFIACVLSMIDSLEPDRLVTPLHLAFSYDEEIGCIGVRRLLEKLQLAPIKPRYCIVGEPTMMQPILAHKGKTAARIHCTGVECHSSLAPQSVNAIYLAAELITYIQAMQQRLISTGLHDHDYDVTHTTLHVGRIDGGTALNIVPRHCSFDFEIRHLPDDDPQTLLDEIQQAAAKITQPLRDKHPATNIEIEILNQYPALNTSTDSDIVEFIRQLTGANSFGKIAFGTEGGLFSRELGVETIVLGPGNIEQAHKPDEYISLSQMQRCDEFLHQLADALCHP